MLSYTFYFLATPMNKRITTADCMISPSPHAVGHIFLSLDILGHGKAYYSVRIAVQSVLDWLWHGADKVFQKPNQKYY